MQVAPDATDVVVRLLDLGLGSILPEGGPGTSWRVALRVSGSRIASLCASDSAIACRVSACRRGHLALLIIACTALLTASLRSASLV